MPVERYFIVVNRPKDMTINEMKEYIHVAVNQWRGGGYPGDPIYDIDRVVMSVARDTAFKDLKPTKTLQSIAKPWGAVALEHLPKLPEKDADVE